MSSLSLLLSSPLCCPFLLVLKEGLFYSIYGAKSSPVSPQHTPNLAASSHLQGVLDVPSAAADLPRLPQSLTEYGSACASAPF